MALKLRSLVLRSPISRRYTPIYSAVLLLVFHTFLVAYINSSYLGQFVGKETVGLIYTVGSAVSVLVFLFISRVLHLVGNFRLTILLLLLNFIAVLGMSVAESIRVAVPLFIMHLISVPLIVFNLDVFMEELIGDNEGATGSRRGLLLTLASLIGAIAPFTSSLLVNGNEQTFTLAYTVAALTLIPIFLILFRFFRDFSDPTYDEIELFAALREFWVHQNVRWVFLAHFSLQIFFMFMVVYSPLYLVGELGLSWSEFGLVMFVAQLAYVVCEYPIGRLADEFIGEKEMMAAGVLIIVLAMGALGAITSDDVVLITMIMFISRVGASLVEVTTESYFFKQIKSSDAQIISFFRVTRPLAYVVGALIGSFTLLYVAFNLLFVVLAVILLPALFFTSRIVDTR